VHRDIRPENILVEIPENKPVQGVKLISFKEAVEIKPTTAVGPTSTFTPISNQISLRTLPMVDAIGPLYY